MGNFKVQGQYIIRGESYDTSATVMAKNEESAKVQLDWILANHHCMCSDCCETYATDYSVHVIIPEGMSVPAMCLK